MSPDDARHGTYAGYNAGCREACCRSAAAAYQRQRYFDYAVLDLPPRHVDKTGTVRRVHALQRLGWSAEDMSVMLGKTKAYLNVTINRDSRVGVNRDTAAAVSELYDRLSMKLGPSDRTRARAERNGWPPPLAWPDEHIDDPDYIPVDWAYRAQSPNRSQLEHRTDILTDLIDRGAGVDDACRMLDIERDSLAEWCRRNRVTHLFEALARRRTRAADGLEESA